MTDSIRACITAAAAAGSLSKEAEKEFLDRLEELFQDGVDTGRLSRHESELRAAARLQKEIERKLARRKRMRVKQGIKQDVLQARLAAAPAGTREKAALSVLDFDPALAHVGENVSMRHQNTRGQAFSIMSDFVDRFRTRHGGLTQDTAGIDDVVKGLFGEKTTLQARGLAQGIMKARQFLVGRHNLAGGDIVKRADWGWVQRHDRGLISAAEKDDWVEFVLDRLDPARMLGPDGEPLTGKGLIAVVRASYDNIIGGDLADMAGVFNKEFTSPVNARIAQRELVFRDSKAWLEYQRRFGDGDIFGAVVGEIDRLSRDVALIEVMGPYPRASLEMMKGTIKADAARGAIEGTGRKARRLAERASGQTVLDATFDQVAGLANIPANSGFARASQSNRNLVTGARLGSALFVSLADAATNALTARMNGVPVANLFRQLFAQLNPADPAQRQMAARAGYISETWIGHAVGAQRLMGELTGSAATARLADTVLRMSGLNWWTDAGRAAFKLELIGHMTDQAGRAFDDIEPALKASLQRHGVTPAQWDLYRSTSLWTDRETGASFIRPEDTWLEVDSMPAGLLRPGERESRFDAAQRIGEMVFAESHFAVVSPTARARALTTGLTRPGTFAGELIRNVTLFRSFSVSFMHLHLSRMMAQRGIRSKSAYLAWITIGMTSAGALAEQMSSISRGRDPKDMNDARFWASAVIRGGSFGPLGDFLYSSTSRHGNNLAEGLLGPVLGSELSAGVKLTLGNVQELIDKGEVQNLGAEFQRFADGLIPGRSLWYARLAMDRLIADELTAWVDGPNAAARFRRMESSARRDFDQRFWWRPGRRRPDRAPDFSNALRPEQ